MTRARAELLAIDGRRTRPTGRVSADHAFLLSILLARGIVTPKDRDASRLEEGALVLGEPGPPRRDALKGVFDFAAVVANDTDLVEPIRIVTQEIGLPITLLTPIAKPATSLAKAASSIRNIQPYIGPCQLPDPIPLPGKKPISKPIGWAYPALSRPGGRGADGHRLVSPGGAGRHAAVQVG